MTCYFVTGAAGFVGSTMADRLLSLGHRVVGYDNFSTGRREFLAGALANPAFTLFEGDLLDMERLRQALRAAPVETVYHFGANADVSRGTENPRRDLEQNTLTTFNLLEAMREARIRRIAFSSTGSIYGEPEVIPTPEDAPFPIQTSLYGASKLACEGLIAAYAEGFGFTTWIFRFVSVLGERYTHGHIFDFYRKLLADPHHIDVLGDGNQRKSYMYVQDCIDAMLLAESKAEAAVNIFNLGVDDTIPVRESLALIVKRLALSPEVRYAGGIRGWVGDSPHIHLDCARIRALGWSPRVSIANAVVRTLEWLMANRWVYEGRDRGEG